MYTPSEAQNVGYVCAALSLLILGSRLIISRWRREPFDTSFGLVLLSILVITGRIITNYYYLRFGTASEALNKAQYFDENNEARIKTGSILVLLARVLLTAALWLQICILLNFYARITSGITWVAWMIRVTWATVIATFVAVVLATFLECRPIELYWQVRPDPGDCVHAFVQLFVQGISNIVIDLMLLVIAYPLVRLRKRSLAEHISLYSLFALGTFCIVITLIRVIFVLGEGAQTTRSLWASVQMLISTFVANTPTIYGSLRVVRRKRSLQRSTPAHITNSVARRRPSRPDTDSWIKIDEEIALTPVTLRQLLSPLPPAATFYDEQSAPAPHTLPSTATLDEDRHQHIGRAA